MPWDVFRAWRVHGLYGDIVPMVHVVALDGGDLVYVRSETEVEAGAVVHYATSAGTHGHLSGESPHTSGDGVCVETWRREDYEDFDLATAPPTQVEALGHFMCGVCLHGQWFGDLFLHMQDLLQRRGA